MAKKDSKKQPDLSDILLDDFDRFERFVVNRWREIVFASVALVVIVAVGATAVNWTQSRRQAAESALTSAATVDELTAAIGKHGASPAAVPASIRLAALLVEDGKHAEADAVLAAVEPRAEGDFRWRAALNRAYIAEMSGKFDDAIDKFTAIGRAAAMPPAARAEACYAAGRLLADNEDTTKSLEMLRLTLDVASRAEGAQFWSDQAENMIKRIESTTAARG